MFPHIEPSSTNTHISPLKMRRKKINRGISHRLISFFCVLSRQIHRYNWIRFFSKVPSYFICRKILCFLTTYAPFGTSFYLHWLYICLPVIQTLTYDHFNYLIFIFSSIPSPSSDLINKFLLGCQKDGWIAGHCTVNPPPPPKKPSPNTPRKCT